MNYLLSCLIFIVLSSSVIVVPLYFWGSMINMGKPLLETTAITIILSGGYVAGIQMIMRSLKHNYGMQEVFK